MNSICPFCKKDLIVSLHDHDRSELRVCHLCLTPTHDTMYKELYSIVKCHYVVDQNKNPLIRRKLVSKAVRVDDFYILIDYDYNISTYPQQYPRTHIYKNITGTIANSLNFEPITEHNPIYKTGDILDLPFDNIELLKNKLKTYTIFS